MDLAAPPSLGSLFPSSFDEIPLPFRHTPDDTGKTLLIDGQVISWNGPVQPTRSAVCLRQADGTFSQIDLGPQALASAAEGRAAVAAASRAWKGGRGDWARASVTARIEAVRKFVRVSLPLREKVAKALMWEVGKPYADSLVEFDRTFKYIEETADALLELERRAAKNAVTGGFAARIRRSPLGVALCMGPYNYALNEVFTLVIPAVIMGNPVIIKTPRYGVLANALLAPALNESFPPGVVALLTGNGPEVVGPMMESGKIDVLAFIGSHKTASILLRQHPKPYRLRTVLGMGAKNPAVVLKDADLDTAAKEIVAGALTFNGQRCTALKHILVEEPVAAALTERLAALVARLPVAMPWVEGAVITPLPDGGHPGYLAGLVRDAVAKGSRVLNPGGGETAGTLFRPAVVSPVAKEALLFSVEQFGPVVPVTPIADPFDAVDIVDQSDFGQQAAIFGKDPKVIAPLVDHFANLVCRTNVNTQCRRGPDSFPFTGRKDSAAGTLSIDDALRVFSIRSLVATPQKEEAFLEELTGMSSFLSRPE
ncbi:MAG: aldehyde dehydrogenase family protein [Thermoanaerobaculia bacterium]|nr:aldehyde dehydrogenase family protein [Thermoanaerobaculia bacterium]